jgi:hypothetical protein
VSDQTVPMTSAVVVRDRLAQCWPILCMLLVVTVLSTFISDRLTINALLNEGLTRGIDVNGILIYLQRAIILLAMALALLGRHAVLRRLFVASIGAVTLGLVTSVLALIASFSHQASDSAFRLLLDGFLLWTMNMLVFAAWYWLIDTSGVMGVYPPPNARQELLFPQLASRLPGWEGWRAGAVDYLYLSFNTNTAFSPSETLFLSRRAKLLMICQALISLVVFAVILGRAVGTIQ